MGQAVTKREFTRVGTDEPHATRRKLILAKYPQIKKLYGPDMRMLPSVIFLVLVQLVLAIAAPLMPTWQIILMAYVIGGTISHSLSLANHELSHNLCFFTPFYNEVLGIISNFGQGIPSAITFKRYHLEHHYYQGVEGIDVDVPTEWEGQFFDTTAKKILWTLLQPFFYAFRPLVVKPKEPIVMEMLNTTIVVVFDLFMVYTFGLWSAGYLLLSTALGMGIHPVAGHFIAEHYQFYKEQETYSYYGPLNLLCFNVGYHNEHHDFPKIAGINLPKVRAMAPEFYEEMKQHESWVQVIYDYISMEHIGPFSRVKRNRPEKSKMKST